MRERREKTTCGYAKGVDAVSTLTREVSAGRHREHPKRNDTQVEDVELLIAGEPFR